MEIQHLGLPPDRTLSARHGLTANHHYTDLRGLTWDDFDCVLEEEGELLDRLARGEDLYDITMEYQTLSLGLDPGVASAVVALVSAGCPTLSSCSGAHGHYEAFPLVVFWCPESVIAAVEDASNYAGTTLVGHGTPGLMVSSRRGELHRMNAFAQALARLQRS